LNNFIVKNLKTTNYSISILNQPNLRNYILPRWIGSPVCFSTGSTLKGFFVLPLRKNHIPTAAANRIGTPSPKPTPNPIFSFLFDVDAGAGDGVVGGGVGTGLLFVGGGAGIGGVEDGGVGFGAGGGGLVMGAKS
jgi:hypothetical protein